MLTGCLIRVRNDHGETKAKAPAVGIIIVPSSAPRPPRRWTNKRAERALNLTKVTEEQT